jgi:hypothetical protein
MRRKLVVSVVSEHAFYPRRSEYEGLNLDQARRLRERGRGTTRGWTRGASACYVIRGVAGLGRADRRHHPPV